MKSYKVLSSMAFAVGACAALAGCSAEAADDGREPEADVQDVVGITDLGLIEKTFGLKLDKKVNGAWSRDVTKGSCYAAYVTGDKPAEYRRYANGAAFFAPNAQYVQDQGHQRPVLCVDLDEAGFSLDGLGLDIAFRFGLGKAIGTDSAMGGEGGFMFERGCPTGRRWSGCAQLFARQRWRAQPWWRSRWRWPRRCGRCPGSWFEW